MYVLPLARSVCIKNLRSSGVESDVNADEEPERQKVGPDLDPNCLTQLYLKEFFDKVNFEKKGQQTTTQA